MSALRQEDDHPHRAFHDPRLTPSENKAAEMALNGFTIQEIADEMDVTRVTVSTFLHYCRKKGVNVHAARSIRDGWQNADLLRMFLSGLSYEQIGERTGINKNTVGVRIHWERKKRGQQPAPQIRWPESVKLDWLRKYQAGCSESAIAKGAGVTVHVVHGVVQRMIRRGAKR